jgi:GNAT superfamily N-acetyltransferase
MKTIPVTTFYLEMRTPPDGETRPPLPGVDVLRVEKPALEYYRSLYDAVGKDWNWIDRKRLSDDALARIIHDDRVEFYVLQVGEKPAGFCELDLRKEGEPQLMYFGLLPEFIGKGLGPFFLNWIVCKAWTYDPRRVWLHTCTLDHQAALRTYLRAGFVLYDQRVINQVVL